MPSLSHKVKNALDEARILVLGTQVLIGAQLRAIFEPGFEHLNPPTKMITLTGLAMLMVAFALINAPGAYHRIVERGEDSPALHRVISVVMAIALLPFAAGLGMDVGVAIGTIAPIPVAVTSGVATSVVALFFWYGIEALASDKKEANLKEEKTSLNQKIVQVLTEARVVLPGAQALLGFQFVIMLTTKFAALPPSTKWVHVAALVCTGLSVVLLMTPAAYHRLVERGENSEHFHGVAGKLLLAAMVPLAVAMCADLFVVVRTVAGRDLPAAIMAGAMAIVFFAIWFGWTLAVRARRQMSPHHREQPA